MSQLRPPLGPRDHVQGNSNAPIALVEYGDYECPYCGRADRIVKALQEALGDDLLFAFRNFPLSQVHPHALRAAAAAEAAALQDRFWEMHDMLFEHQRALGDEHLVEYAGRVGLDTDSFVVEMERGAYQGRVREDFLGGVRSGVNGTPTFFIDGVRFDGDWSDVSTFRNALARPTMASAP